MKLSQYLRRLQWRARRFFFKTADNDPLVILENEPTKPAAVAAAKPAKRWWDFSSGLLRALWLIAAFLITLSLLAGLYVWFVAQESRITVDVAPPVEVARGVGSSSILSAVALIQETIRPADALKDQDMLLAPSAKQARRAWLNDGAAATVGRFLDQLNATRTVRREDLLAAAQLGMARGGAEGREAARVSLIQYNDQLARGVARLDVSDAAQRAMLLAATLALQAEAEAIATVIGASRDKVAPRETERFFFRGRGVALGWRRMLEAWLNDAPERAFPARRAALVGPFAALEQAANFQPTLIANAAPGSSFQPNHLSHLAFLLSQAALRLNTAASES